MLAYICTCITHLKQTSNTLAAHQQHVSNTLAYICTCALARLRLRVRMRCVFVCVCVCVRAHACVRVHVRVRPCGGGGFIPSSCAARSIETPLLVALPLAFFCIGWLCLSSPNTPRGTVPAEILDVIFEYVYDDLEKDSKLNTKIRTSVARALLARCGWRALLVELARLALHFLQPAVAIGGGALIV
jgi:hypothetical protein